MEDQQPSNGASLPDRQITSDFHSYDDMQTGQSLGGAESMMRDINMASPEGSSPDAGVGAANAAPHQAANPGTPKANNGDAPEFSGSDQITPRPKPKKFSRQIVLDVGPSFYYDPYDPTTHNLEYASKVSGRDFVGEAAAEAANNAGRVDNNTLPLQATMGPPTSSRHTRSSARVYLPTYPVLPHVVPAKFLQPPAKLGMLISSTDSFTQIFWTLNKRIETFGRQSTNTLIYPDAEDTRIPKTAVCIYFHAQGIEKLEKEGRDWTTLPGLQTVLTTRSHLGIWINGFQLKGASEAGYQLCGRVYTGDVITVFAREDGTCLRLVCKFEVGEGRNPRPKDRWPFEVNETKQQLDPVRTMGPPTQNGV